MNSRFDPASAIGGTADQSLETAIVTASYASDFERCRLLCETMDRFVTGFSRHYLLVEHGDVSLFRTLENERRVVVDEKDLLPGWLRSYRDPTSLFRRRIWLSARTMPLRGWHVQQLRRIAIAGNANEDVLVYCDSDVLFLKPFDCGAFQRNGETRLFRRENALAGMDGGEHARWSRNAGKLLGIADPPTSPHDYIATLIAWRRDAVVAMCRRIEEISGKQWAAAIGADRRYSECMIYGRFADEILKGKGHFHAIDELCRVHWTGEPLSDEAFRQFAAGMTPGQVAIGLQSFIGTDLRRIRGLIETASL